jgi:hypothetical protein
MIPTIFRTMLHASFSDQKKKVSRSLVKSAKRLNWFMTHTKLPIRSGGYTPSFRIPRDLRYDQQNQKAPQLRFAGAGMRGYIKWDVPFVVLSGWYEIMSSSKNRPNTFGQAISI